jgi:1-acyl-sn-glycerol-3-phosphate acyltransferase
LTEDEGAWGYRLVRALVRVLLAVFYRRIEVVATTPVPTGPLIVAANHHNSVVDAMLLLAVIPRRLRTLANAPLFRHPLIGPFLRLLGALPVHRRQESGDDPSRNAALFDATTTALRGGGAILIFPEGRTQPEPALQELRTGAARMLLAAEAPAPAGVTLLPVGLVFQQPGTFRDGQGLVQIGAPIETDDAVALAASAPLDAARLLTDRLGAALRALIVEADDRQTLRLLGLVEGLWREAGSSVPRTGPGQIAWLQRAAASYHVLLRSETVRVSAFRQALEAYAATCERVGVSAAEPPPRETVGSAVRFVLHQAFALLVGAPLALLGIVLHFVPYQLTAAAVHALHATDEEEATDKIAAGLVMYPSAWALEAWGAYRIGGPWGLALLAAALVPCGFFALAWRERLGRLRREARAFFALRGDPALRERLQQERGRLAGELQLLARSASDHANSGEGGAR